MIIRSGCGMQRNEHIASPSEKHTDFICSDTYSSDGKHIASDSEDNLFMELEEEQ